MLVEVNSNNYKISDIIPGKYLDIEEIDLGNSPIVLNKISDMFYNCENLENIVNLNKLDTSNVKAMENVFSHCRKLKSVDLSNFNTSNVTTMYNMFMDCNSLEYIDISKFNVSKLTSTRNMFHSCHGLKNINFGTFNTKNINNMSGMFYWCKQLKNINLVIDCSSIDSEEWLDGMFAESGITDIVFKNVRDNIKNKITPKLLKYEDSINITFV